MFFFLNFIIFNNNYFKKICFCVFSINIFLEVIELYYDEKICSYSDLIEYFFSHHDPTVKRKHQYQSAIYYIDEEQRISAECLIAKEQVFYH